MTSEAAKMADMGNMHIDTRAIEVANTKFNVRMGIYHTSL